MSETKTNPQAAELVAAAWTRYFAAADGASEADYADARDALVAAREAAGMPA